jgi:8-amino-7-oxononanoate synthase
MTTQSQMPSSIDAELEDLRERSLLRRLREIESSNGPDMEFAGRKLVNFASNDYLGFASEPALREAAKAAIDQYGVGTGASRLVSGTLSAHVRLEERIASFKHTEASLVFSSGYATAVGTLGALCRRDDVVILDKLSHASLIDGAKLSGAVVRVFPHNHLGKLESHLSWARENYPDARIVVVTESVFSMDGDWAPLQEIITLKNRFNALLLLDEAHAVGVIGHHGRGLAAYLDLADKVDIQMGTLSKALGCSGGYICGSRRLIDLLVNRARSFIYSTAPSPAVAAAAHAAIDFLDSPAGERRRQTLRGNLAQFAEEMPGLFGNGRKVQSAIIPVVLGSATAALEAAQDLGEKGYFVPAIRYPTVPKDAARLRVTISARHGANQISGLCGLLRSLIPVQPVQPEATDT